MAEININNKDVQKKNKPQKATLRVDFTPLVDMNMLLICFFMFCTTLSISQVMDIAMPADGSPTKSPESRSLTLILDRDEVYYYHGFPDYEDFNSLKKTNYRNLRNVLLDKNAALVEKVSLLKQQFAKKEISQKDYKLQMENIKKSKDGAIVMIKPLKSSSYRNLVETLDEMQICNIGQYTILEVEEADNFLLDNLNSKSELTALSNKKLP